MRILISLAIVMAALATSAAAAGTEVTVKDFGKADLYLKSWGTHPSHVLYDDEKNPARKQDFVFEDRDVKLLELPSDGAVARTADGKHTAYRIKKDWKEAVVCDDKEGPLFSGVGRAFFLPDGRTLIYDASNGQDKQFVVIDGRPLGPYDGIRSWAFSPDGKRMAITVSRKDKMMIICDAAEGPAYDAVSDPCTFSPDSRNLAYTAHTEKGAGKGDALILNGKKVAGAKSLGIIGLTPDSRQLVWVSGEGEDKAAKTQVQALDVATGKSTPLFTTEALFLSAAAISPDGKHLAFFTASGNQGKLALTVDGKPLPPVFDGDSRSMPGDGPGRLDTPGFSADGRHVFCRGVRETHDPFGQKRFMVVDGVPRPEHDDLWILAECQNSPQRLRYVVKDGDKYRLVETAWPEDTTWEKAVGSPAKE
jgi:hypothetical protein